MSFRSSRSNNSSGKSKRSLDSNSTKASDGSNSSKKRKANQKTLGMAWGANSLSSSKSASWKSPFTDFGSYMLEKNRKLQDQFEAEASSSSLGNTNSDKPLFRGVSIFVDGFTVPSSQELRGYMLKYGGRFENYFSRHRVTHIICSNLPVSKIKNLRSFSGGLPVVKPTWVLDCVLANRLLSWLPYQLDQLVNQNCKQPKLSAFFSPKSNSSSEDADTPGSCLKLGSEVSLPRVDSCHVRTTCEMAESLQSKPECSGEIPFAENTKSCEEEKEELVFNDDRYSELSFTEANSARIQNESRAIESLQSSPCRSSASANDCGLNNQNAKDSSNPSIPVTSNQCHSTFGDPNFVENYFKNSRLHFIGTWRTRYRKRFPTTPGANCASLNTKALSIPQRSAVVHVDMDCFFVSVVIRHHPELQDMPVAVCHSDSPRGTAEISSANYPARDFGVKAGIFVRDAKALCPHLVIVPYNFEAYEEVADQFYNILHKHCNKVQAVSCDEAFLDVTDQREDPQSLASAIRQEIVGTTGCTASAGIAGNMLLARLATRTAKPNGQCFISPEKVDDYLNELPIKALPGVGHVLAEKLKKQHIQTCGQLRVISKESLQKDFGMKTGNMLWNYSRGVDNRPVGVVQDTKSVGAEVNWGVRFNDLKDSENFLVNLCNEVSLRLQECGVQGRTITMKVKKRRKDAKEPAKYMGCGDCENLSHSITVPTATDDVNALHRICKQIFGTFQIDVREIRGIGLHVSRLENADLVTRGQEKNALRMWLNSASSKIKDPINPFKENKDGDLADGSKQSFDGNSGQLLINSISSVDQTYTNQSITEACLSRVSTLPPLCDLDIGVIESLPPEIFSEVNEMYSGKLNDFIGNRKQIHGISDSLCTTSEDKVEGAVEKGKTPLFTKNKEKESVDQGIQPTSASGAVSSNMHIPMASADRIDIMPVALSQVDISVLDQLPEEMKVDILELLPAHSKRDYSSECPIDSAREHPPNIVRMEDCKNVLQDSVSSSLWVGNPPIWVDIFDISNHSILNLLAKMYYQSGSTGLLSSILQSAISVLPHLLDVSIDGEGEVISRLCQLLQQYIELKIKSDVEELYICFRLLRSEESIVMLLTTSMASDIFIALIGDLFHQVYGEVELFLTAL